MKQPNLEAFHMIDEYISVTLIMSKITNGIGSKTTQFQQIKSVQVHT